MYHFSRQYQGLLSQKTIEQYWYRSQNQKLPFLYNANTCTIKYIMLMLMLHVMLIDYDHMCTFSLKGTHYSLLAFES